MKADPLTKHILTEEMIVRFWDKVDKRTLDGCWVWTASTNGRGYGRFWAGKCHVASRISFVLKHGVIPDGKEVCHSCDNKLCVNPGHLFAGTHLENIKDAGQKGRIPKGEGKCNSKLTTTFVKEIKQLLSERKLSRQKIANMYGVSHIAVQNIDEGKSWRHVPGNTGWVSGGQPKGEKVWQAKLTEEKVKEIRRIKSCTQISNNALAKKFGVKEMTVWKVVNLVTWKHVA